MIVYELACASDHRFEAWFRDGEGFEKQAAAGEIACPVCGDTQVTRALTAPHVRRSWPAPLNPIQMNWQGSLASGS